MPLAYALAFLHVLVIFIFIIFVKFLEFTKILQIFFTYSFFVIFILLYLMINTTGFPVGQTPTYVALEALFSKSTVAFTTVTLAGDVPPIDMVKLV